MLQTILCFLAPLTVAVELDLAGGVFLAEIVLPCTALFFLIRKKFTEADKAIFNIAKLATLYFFGLIFSDIWNDSDFDQYSRGWARLVVFLVNLIAIYILVDNKRHRLIAVTLGFAVGRILLVVANLDELSLIWKMGFSKPAALITVLICVALLSYRRSLGIISPGLLFLLGIYNLAMDFRSLAAVLIATTILLVASDLRVGLRYRLRAPGQVLPIIGACGLLTAGLTYGIYVYAAKTGWLAEAATNKFQTQAEETDLPLLIAGRSEILVSLEAILDAPLIGHGSWPEDRYYADKIALKRYQHRLSGSVPLPKSDLIPTHSHLIGGWVEAGLAGGAFWIVVLYVVGLTLARSLLGHSPMRPLYIYCSLLLVWDVLFSPFSGFRRLETAYLLIVVLRASLQRSTLLPGGQTRRPRARRSRRRTSTASDRRQSATRQRPILDEVRT